MTHYQIPEIRIPGKPLGRHVNHDVRSFGFPFVVEQPRTLVNTYWPRHNGMLDQANVGACTGFAMCGCCGTGPVWDGLPPSHPVLNNAEGFTLYSQATNLDPYPGAWVYPPPPGSGDDTGSDGVSVMKAAVNDYLISGYTHTFDLNTALQAIMTTPVIIGLNWYSSFDSPAPDGTVSISGGAFVRGGHEVLVRGINVDHSMVLLDNSWGLSWGVEGTFQFSFATFQRLLNEDGDCTVPMPLSAPPLKPVPVIWSANGTMSLTGLSAKRGTPVSTILKNTVKQYKAYSGIMSQYLQQGDLSQPIPAGEKLCLAWPQYDIK